MAHTVWRVGAERVRRSDRRLRPRSRALYRRRPPSRGERRRARALGACAGGRGRGVPTRSRGRVPRYQVKILPYNRIVKDLAGRSPDAVSRGGARSCRCAGGPATPARKGEVSMYRRPARWYTLDCSESAPAEGVDGPARSTWRSCSGTCSSRARHRRRAHRQAHRLRRRRARHDGARAGGRSGRAAVAFSMYPVTMDDLMAIADAGGIMPPKSTWFEPKLRDGLLVHLI